MVDCQLVNMSAHEAQLILNTKMLWYTVVCTYILFIAGFMEYCYVNHKEKRNWGCPFLFNMGHLFIVIIGAFIACLCLFTHSCQSNPPMALLIILYLLTYITFFNSYDKYRELTNYDNDAKAKDLWVTSAATTTTIRLLIIITLISTQYGTIDEHNMGKIPTLIFFMFIHSVGVVAHSSNEKHVNDEGPYTARGLATLLHIGAIMLFIICIDKQSLIYTGMSISMVYRAIKTTIAHKHLTGDDCFKNVGMFYVCLSYAHSFVLFCIVLTVKILKV